jgi:hypothetical protein
VSTLAAERWTTTERGECLLCTADDDRSKVDTGTDLEDGRRVYVCGECTTRLAKIAPVGSKAVDAVREQLEGELRVRDESIAALSAQLGSAEASLVEQRELLVQRGEALAQAKVLASTATASLQQIGALE